MSFPKCTKAGVCQTVELISLEPTHPVPEELQERRPGKQ